MSRAPELKRAALDGIELAYWDWPGAGPPLLFVHATGFHGRCWDQIVRHFPGRRAIAPDMRGHGRSPKPDPPYHWMSFGRDLARLIRALDLREAFGIGHSMGGHSLIGAAAELPPETFTSLLLVDPTVFTRERYGTPARDASFIARRRNVFESPAKMYERFAGRLPFSRWNPDVLRDYCEFGLVERGDHYVLACPPEIERSIYGHSTEADADLHPLLAFIRQPVTVIRGGILPSEEVFNLDSSPTDPALANAFAHGRDVFLEGRSHYIPMETPELVAEYVQGMSTAPLVADIN